MNRVRDKGHLLQDQEYQLWKDRGMKVCMVPTLRISDGTGLPVDKYLDVGILPGLGYRLNGDPLWIVASDALRRLCSAYAGSAPWTEAAPGPARVFRTGHGDGYPGWSLGALFWRIAPGHWRWARTVIAS